MSEPPIIGSGKPHTVTLAEGSSVATQRPTRAAGGRLPEEPPAPVREGQLPEPAPHPPRKTAHLRAQTQPAHVLGPRAAGPRPGSRILDPSPLLTRIAQVEQRNGQIRARLAPSESSPKKAGTEPR